jgi:hypothetical protein
VGNIPENKERGPATCQQSIPPISTRRPAIPDLTLSWYLDEDEFCKTSDEIPGRLDVRQTMGAGRTATLFDNPLQR